MVTSANAAIREEPVTYTDGETTMKGFVVYDDASQAKRPGIVMVSRFNAGRDQLAKQASVNPQRIGAVGYCFGGAVVLNMARSGADLAAVAGHSASLGLNTPR